LAYEVVTERAALQLAFNQVADFTAMIFTMPPNSRPVLVANLTSLVDTHRVQLEIVQPLAAGLPLNMHGMTYPLNREQWIADIVAGRTIVLVEGAATAYSIQLPSPATRSVQESQNENVIPGPRDSFTESWQTNLGLIRRRIQSPQLRVEAMTIGTLTNTTCALLSIAGLTPDPIYTQIRMQLLSLHPDALIDSSQLEQLLEPYPYSPFEQIENTERPDRASMELLRGRLVILVDNAASALILPTTFFDLQESPVDQYQRPLITSIRKLIRMAGFFIATYLSSIYLSLVLYHAHLIPEKFVIILAEKRVQVPFPAWFEIIVMHMMIDMTLEAIIRLPAKLGQIIGVAGAIVLGQAITAVHLISPTVIVIVAVTTIAGYVQAHLSSSFSIYAVRYFNLALASMLGLYGVMLSAMFWLVHLCSLNAYHTPYLRPLSPFDWATLRDRLIRLRVPWVADKQNARWQKKEDASS
jgi:hypothetical protein